MDYHLDGECRNARFHGLTFASRDQEPRNVLLTGASGFLGSYVLAGLLNRTPRTHVYAHVRVDATADPGIKIKETCEAYGIWNDGWLVEKRLDFVVGNLSEPNLGIAQKTWDTLADKVDVVIHCGARYVRFIVALVRSPDFNSLFVGSTGFIPTLNSHRSMYNRQLIASRSVAWVVQSL